MAGRILILGAPGAGKGTQARRIAKKFDLPHISTGDIFRSQMERGTELGKKIEEFMHAGQLVPDELACAIVVERLVESDCRNGYILDGFPRTIPQAEGLDSLLNDMRQIIDSVLVIDVNHEEIVKRLSSRRSCKECDTVYNLLFDPPASEGNCDRCDGILYQRDDDRPVTIRQRLEVYSNQTSPLINFYTQKGLVETIDGAGKIDQVRERMFAALS